MSDKKSVAQAIQRGQVRVNVPTFLFMILLPALGWFITPLVVSEKYQVIGVVLGLILGFVAAWLWWSYQVPVWRIWAFQNTEPKDWPELKRQAIEGKLIWPDGNIFEKTEVRTNKQKQIIRQINEAINHVESNLDFVEDDPNIPESQTFYFKKGKILYSIFTRLIWLPVGGYLLTKELWFFAFIAFGIALYKFNFKSFKNIKNHEPQLFINSEGIDLKFNELGIIEWSLTESIRVDTKTGILKLRIWRGDESFDINFPLFDLDIQDYDDFLRTINVYLKRSTEKNS